MSKIEEMNKSLEDLTKQVDETLLALDDIKRSIEDSGKTVGNAHISEYADVVSELYEDGVKSEYDRFWDAYQDYGKRIRYQYAFAGFGWTKETFKPKYDIKPTSVKNLFGHGGLANCDLTEILNTLEIVFDTSNVTAVDGFASLCEYSGPKRVPAISTVSCPRIKEMFYYADYLTTVDKLILKEDGSQIYTNAFIGCVNLTNIVIDGTIGGNDFSVKDSPLLSKASITSIVNALSTTTTDLTVTLSLTAVNNAFETSTGLADGLTSQEWLDLVATKSNWTISLV